MNIPKTLTGIGITLLGAFVGTIPLIQAASPIIMKAGGAIIVIGIGDKVRRKINGQSVLNSTEKTIIQKMKGNKNV